jgi:hypothetical protein
MRLRRKRADPSQLDFGKLLETAEPVTDWTSVDCPGCGCAVLFLPRQAANICGWCARTVRRGVG